MVIVSEIHKFNYMTKIAVKKSRKELWMWRIIFIVATAIFINKKDNEQKEEIKEDSIVSTSLHSEILYDEELLNNIYELADNDKVKGVLLKVNCPGGELTASEAVYKAFSEVRNKKPLVVSIQSVAASGGYMISVAANKIYSYNSSTVGSIGVMNSGFIDPSGLENKLGIKFFNYKSSPLKALPDGYDILGLRFSREPNEEGAKHLQKVIDEFQSIFKEIIQKNRPQIKDIELATNGEEFTGKYGLELGLIDAIGTDRDALKDLQTNFNLKADLPLVDYNIVSLQEESSGFFSKALGLIKILITN